MKKIISLVLTAVLLVSAVPTALATNDYSQGTQVVYEATGSESYTITVPAKLAPGGSGTVTLQGTWADNRIITVTAEPTVTLTNSIKAEDQKVLNVHFDGISEAGSNTGSQTFTESVSVDNITNALFGTWSGKFNYNVDIENIMDSVYDGSTDGYMINCYMSETGEVQAAGAAYTEKFDVVPGETLYVTFANERYSNSYDGDKPLIIHAFLNGYGSFLCYDENDSYVTKLTHQDFQYADLGNINVLSITVPENTKSMLANLNNIYSISVTPAKYLRIYRNAVTLNTSYQSVLASESALTERKVIAFGDSITLGFGNDNISYIDYISAVNNMKLIVRATGGHNSQQILSAFGSYSSKVKSLGENDYVIISGFVNDPTKDIPLGELTPDGTTEFDITTSIGAIEQFCYNYVNNPEYKAKLGFILTAKPYGENAYRDKPEYWDAAISVLEKYNIPYINLYSETIECSDGVHPNATGHKDMAALIEAWMNTI